MASSLILLPKVLTHESEFDKAYAFAQPERTAMELSWSMYSGFDYGQWQKEAIAYLQANNRHIAQYNIVRGKVQNLAGSIIKNNLDVDFVPVDSEISPITRFLKGTYYSDKEMFDWDMEHMHTVVDGLIHSGVEEMYISDKYNVLGNIAFKRCMPGHIVLDPHWVSHKSEDMKQLWKVAYLTPDEIKKIYNHKSDRIDALLMQRAMMGETYEDDQTSLSIQRFNLSQLYGTKYRVIERHHLEETPIVTEIWVSDKYRIEIPNGLDDEAKKDYVEQLKSEYGDTGRIIEHRSIQKEYWVTTSCAQLDQVEFLEDKKAEIQIGRLPFFPWSAERINGRNSGIVQLLMDAQQALNKRESLSDQMIANSSHGSRFLDPSVVGNNDAKLDAIIRDFDKPNATFITAPGAIASGRKYIQQIDKIQYQGEIYQEIERMAAYIDKISKVDETMEGRSSGSEDTGVFFARRQMQSEIALTTLIKGLEQHWNDKGEGYMLLAQQIYPGAFREFRTGFGENNGEKTVIKINAGGPFASEFKNMPRHKVVVSQSPSGVTVRNTERAINSEVQARTPENQYVYKATLQRNIMRTLDGSDEDKKAIEAASEIEMTLAIERAKTEIAEMRVRQAQAEAVLAQMQGGGQPQIEEQQEQPQEQQTA